MSAQEFGTAVDRLIARVARWEAPRWAHAGRGDRVFALVQSLADRGADAEGRPRRPVPRLADPVLPDQVRVTADDLLTAGAPAQAYAAAAAEVAAVSRALDG